MPLSQQHSPYWQSRAIAEKVLESQGLVPGAYIETPKGQHWHLKGGIRFAIQWLGESFDYVDSDVIAHILAGVADWRAKNPNTYC